MNSQSPGSIEERLVAAYAARLDGIDDAALTALAEPDASGRRNGAVPRRGTGQRFVLVAAACLAVVAVALGLLLTGGDHRSPAPPGHPRSSPPSPSVLPSTTAVPLSASTSPSSGKSAARSSAGRSNSSPPTSPITRGALWNSPVLILTGDSLGGVRIGMTRQEAARAAGVPSFVFVGDGVLQPSNEQPDYVPHLYLGNFAGQPASTVGGDFSCIGAIGGTGTAHQVITTQQGLHLGDPAARVRQLYGSSAVFVPLPTTGGIAPSAGYVVHEGRYDLVFKVDQHNTRVVGMAGGIAPMNPSDCNS